MNRASAALCVLILLCQYSVNPRLCPCVRTCSFLVSSLRSRPIPLARDSPLCLPLPSDALGCRGELIIERGVCCTALHAPAANQLAALGKAKQSKEKADVAKKERKKTAGNRFIEQTQKSLKSWWEREWTEEDEQDMLRRCARLRTL
eukprot:7341787-Prymnesium_polylepis.2